MNTQTDPDFSRECCLEGCPCHKWSAESPSEPPTTGEGDAGFLVPEAENVSQGEYGAGNSISASDDTDYWRRITQEANVRNGYGSPALRRTRSILHHAEIVEEQKRREHRDDCGVWIWPGGACSCAGQNMLDAVSAHRTPITSLTFDDAWNNAPESIRRVTEIEAAELFYYAGRRDRETEMLREVNEVLSGVVGRIEQERVR